jgi:hypothetical protein
MDATLYIMFPLTECLCPMLTRPHPYHIPLIPLYFLAFLLTWQPTTQSNFLKRLPQIPLHYAEYIYRESESVFCQPYITVVLGK